MTYPDDWYARLQAATFDEPPLYCTRCATPMLRIERRRGYTTRGVPVIVPGYTCPKNRSILRRAVSLGIAFHDEVWAETLGEHGYWDDTEGAG